MIAFMYFLISTGVVALMTFGNCISGGSNDIAARTMLSVRDSSIGVFAHTQVFNSGDIVLHTCISTLHELTASKKDSL